MRAIPYERKSSHLRFSAISIGLSASDFHEQGHEIKKMVK